MDDLMRHSDRFLPALAHNDEAAIVRLSMIKRWRSSCIASPEFIAIAFDAGGAATGPMAVTFILSMTCGVAKQCAGRDPLLDGFGMVSLFALAPILSILILGFLYNRKQKAND